MTPLITSEPCGSGTGYGPLRDVDVGAKLVRGGVIRAGGYGIGMLLAGAASVLLLRHLGVVGFGRYMTVMSVLAIVSAVTDAGLSAVAARELALRSREAKQRELLANLLGLRLSVTAAGVFGAIGFVMLAGYGRTLVVGTVAAGVGVMLATWQSTVMVPSSVRLQIGRFTASEVTRQAATLLAVATLVAAGASLLPFFATGIAVAGVTLAVTPLLAGRRAVWRPAFDLAQWRELMLEALPLAASIVIDVTYFRLLLILVSLLASAFATGLYATSLRIVDVLYGLAGLIETTSLPVLAAVASDRQRLSSILLRMTEVGAMAGCYLVLIVEVVATPALEFIGGGAYRAAAPVLRIQVIALIPVCLGHVWQGGLIATRRRRGLMTANALALAVVLTLAFVLVPHDGAKGAAVTAAAAEVAFAGALFVFLARTEGELRPRLRFVWKVVLASAVGAALAMLPGLPTLASPVLATLGYVATLWRTRAIPAEILDALVGRFTLLASHGEGRKLAVTRP